MSLLLLSAKSTTFAGSATWQTNPGSGDWNTATNWMPNTVPNGPSDTATFAASNVTDVSLSAITEVNGIVFNPGANAFRITAGPTLTLTVSGAGITNNSGIAQEFVTTGFDRFRHGTIQFTNGATAGDFTFINNRGPESNDEPGGITQFFDSSSAANASISNTTGSSGGYGGGGVEFYDKSTAGNAGFSNQGGRTFILFFAHTSTAGNGTFTNAGAYTDESRPGTFAFSNVTDVSSAGTVFTVINNTAATPIAGAFSNLPDGATFTSNGNSFKADYQGRNGNDLTLTVVPWVCASVPRPAVALLDRLDEYGVTGAKAQLAHIRPGIPA